MKRGSVSEKVFTKELSVALEKVKGLSRNISLGGFIKLIRLQLGMTQKILSDRAKVPQSTISRIEKGQKDANISTIQKILKAMHCDLLIFPMLLDSIDNIRRKQAMQQAKIHMKYLKGTMNLENQQPDSNFMNELLKEEEEKLLRNSGTELWRLR